MITRQRMREELSKGESVAREASRLTVCRECRGLFEPPPPRPGIPRSICPDCTRAYRRGLGEKMQAALRGQRQDLRGPLGATIKASQERQRSGGALKTGQQRDRIARILRGGKLLSPECGWAEETSDGYRWYDMPGVGEDMQKLNFVLFRRLPVSLRGCWIRDEKKAAVTAAREDLSEE